MHEQHEMELRIGENVEPKRTARDRIYGALPEQKVRM
jgi:hypothetical protein